ncbi:MAG: T9SS type A sorting domain-containing protein [Salinivirgaceae bacterium]|nr:T9SS type A sorting domain-containing protein [Salinivirgaceae bacterium]
MKSLNFAVRHGRNTSMKNSINVFKLPLLVVLLLLFVVSVKSQNTVATYNFDTDDEGWTSSSGWLRDNTADTKFTGSDGNYWHTDPFDNYVDDMDVYVTSEVINLSNYGYLTLELDICYNSESRWDGFNIEYYNGSSWNILGSVGDGTNWYDDSDVDALGNNIHGWSGNNDTWTTASLSLPSELEDNSAVQFRVRFASDGSVKKDGVGFDNFKITGYYTTSAFSQTFDTDNEGWSSSSGWVRDNAADAQFSGSDGNYWHNTPFNNYSSNTNATVTSGIFDLTGKSNLVLQFDLRYNTKANDGVTIEYFNGTSWAALGAVGQGTNWYNDADIDGIANNTDGWTGDNLAWQTASLELPAELENNANVKFKMLFGTNGSGNDDGVAFDNFRINEFSETPPIPPKTWYAYSTLGNWSDASSWTLDGASNPLYVNSNSQIPSATDYVAIPSGKKITILSSNNEIEISKLDIYGALDLSSSHDHNFNVINGDGTILMSGYDPGTGAEDNFPSATATNFTDAENGGTVEIYGDGIKLNQERTFNNLSINLSSGSATLLADYTINNNLIVENGDFKINDNSSSTTLNLAVSGNVTIESTGSISVGTANATDAVASSGYGNYHKYFHVFTVLGDFTNQGSMRLTNETSPDYITRTSNGAVSLVFSGASNNTFYCEGTTDLYYLVIDKGSNQTYGLTINATNKSYFSLFGDNNAEWDITDEQNPENRKSLWIKAGKLTLEGYINIPTLVEGTRDYSIGANAALILNGDNVFVSVTAVSSIVDVHNAIDYSGLSYSSSNGINDGDGTQGIYLYGLLKINKGTFHTSYSHGIVYRAESSANSLEINGGEVYASQFRISGAASSATAKMNYTHTGGDFYLTNNRTDAAIFDLSAELGGFTMEGGTIHLNDLSNGAVNAISIACAPTNINVSGGTIILDNLSGTSATATISTTAPFHNFILRNNQNNNIQLLSNIELNNDLVIENEDFNANGFDVSIGSDLNISSGATYTTGNNTTTFGGSKQTNLYLPTLQLFNNVIVNKTVNDKNFVIVEGLATAFKVNGEFRLEKGVFDYGEFTAELNGDVFIADSVGKFDNTGKIYLHGSSLQNLSSDNGIIQNMDIDNTNNVNLSGDLNITGTLTLSDGIFDINSEKLTLFGSNASISGIFDNSKMIQTSGNASDGGLNMYIDANETITLPLGTDANATIRYTPAVATLSNFSDDGYINISVADAQLPMTIGNGGDILSYYWKVQYSDFTELPTISSYIFTHDASDEDGGNVNNFKAGKVLDIDPYSQSTENGYNKTSNEITFNDGFILEEASYTAGNPSRFAGAPDVYYSRQAGNFNTAATWSKNDPTGNGTQEVPVAGSIIIIQDGNRVNVQAAIPDIGIVKFSHDYDTYPDAGSEDVARLQFLIAGTFNLGTVSGTGMISFNAPAAPIVNGDFGDFGSNQDSYFLYFGGNNTLNAIPTPIPNLMMESATYTIDQEISTNANVIIQGNGTVKFMQDATIQGNLVIGTWLGGTVELPSQAMAITLTVNGNIDFTIDPVSNLGDRNLQVQSLGTNNVEHKIILKGNLLHGSDNSHAIDLWNSNSTERVILELQGASDNYYSRTSTAEPELYRVIVNKGLNQTNSFSFNESFTLKGATNTIANKSFDLQNGKLIINDADININLTTGNPFSIPSSAALELTAGTLNCTGTEGGITLDGLLTINGGTLDLEDGSSNDNFIQYGSSGNAKLFVASGTLKVGTQIRRLTTNNSGVLTYNQTGGNVIIGVNSDINDYEPNRGMLEVLNDGSDFTYTNGSLTIVRQNGSSPAMAALYLNPTSNDVTGSTITIGNENTPEAQNNFGINSSIPLNNLTLFADGSLTDNLDLILESLPLTLTGNLTIGTDATFDGNSLNVTIGGNLINNGDYTSSANTTTFNSENAQSISGSGTEDFYNLIKSGTGTLSAEKDISINNNLVISAGTLNSDSYSINLLGDVTIDGSCISSSGYGLQFLGASQQNLQRSTIGSSHIGIMTINNSNGVKVSNNDHSFVIDTKLRLQRGVFNIGGSLLEFGSNAIIEEVESFTLLNMIQTNSSFQDNGIKKNFSVDYTTDFIFPIGQSKYTPVTLNLSSSGKTSGTTEGSFIVRPANEYHPVINDGSDELASGDINNVLQYYWILRSNGLTNFTSDIILKYDENDALITEGGYALSDYIAARILSENNPTELINKYSTSEVDEASQTVTYSFNSVSDNDLSGDYFAGIDNAIPNNVATYTTNSSGNITNANTFNELLPTDGVAPTGAVLIVSTGDELTFNVNDVNLYKTEIQSGATLTIEGTEHHRLGTVNGTGNIKIVSNSSSISFPAGDYLTFFSCAGGGIEYTGSGNYNILSGLTSLRNLTLSGSGTKELANNDVVICENFNLNGPDFDNASNKDLSVQGNLNITNGIFNSGKNNIIDIDGIVTVNGGTYNGESSGNDIFGELVINSGTFNTGTGGNIFIESDFTYAGGTFDGGSGTAKILLNGNALQTVNGNFSGASAFNNFELANANGLNLNGNVTIDNELTLTSGLINPGTNTLLMEADAMITPENGSSSSYINGKLSKVLANSGDEFIFPVGTNGQWGYAGVHNVSTAGLTWDVEYLHTSATAESLVTNLNPTDALAITSISTKEYWKITDNGSSNANISLSWNGNSDVSADQTEREKLKVVVWNGASWDNFGGTTFSAGHTQMGGSFTSSTAVSFSEKIITLGSGDASNPLPVELIYFAANSNIDDVELMWGTASEKNNDYFEIQRSEDAQMFYTIGKVSGFGNSTAQIDYTFLDEIPVDGIAYYRLKQVDYDGKFTIHKTIKVDWDQFVLGEDDEIQIYPNPYISGDLTLIFTELEPYTSITIMITNFKGNMVSKFSINVPDRKKMNLIPMAIDQLPKGIYFLTVVTSKAKFIKKIIVE